MANERADRAKDNLLRLAEVRKRTGLGRTTIYRKISAGSFPGQTQISDGLVAWYESDIDAWIADPMAWAEVSQNGVGV